MQPDMYTVASNPVIADGENAPLTILFAGESQTKPLHRLGPKVYDFYLMHIVLEGKGIFVCDGTRHELRAGHTFLIEPEQLISYESDSDEPWRYRWVAFTGTHSASLVADAGFKSEQQIVFTSDKRRAAILFRRIYETFRSGGIAADLEALGYLHLLFAEYKAALHALSGSSIRTAKADGDHLLQQVIHYLSTQYAHPVSIEQMAESLGYNRAYLSRLFKQRTGVSPINFLLTLRIDKARQMLRERSELTIEQISASVGLQDALYFSKQFRRLHGQSPTAYREAMRSIRGQEN
ncbi:AraC family transcriptional regulator [Paenibacillus sp. FSL H8-0548]|uniref:AraC family transcriptional regulator n=1 Tax=Paenibacillus sp. FSL H8-0548 TaxID=1920422 RepID=UPI00096F979A|nr:AraC family transcriptional regulator [Paenibacillus sp. FSL H8-0548]OMF22361.1 AraC family transcriptional regulator [Paenibacillus sp. FSL H8-0548]